MNPQRKTLLYLIMALLAFSPFAAAQSRQPAAPFVKVIEGPRDVPGSFSSLARKGDFLVFDGRDYAVLGASPRQVITSMNYPYGQAMGSLLAFAPSGEMMPLADLSAGAPVLRIGDKTHHLGYAEIIQFEGTPVSMPLTFEARGSYEDKEGRKAAIKSTYVFRPDKGWLEIASTLTNTGKAPLENLGFSLFFDPYTQITFSPYHEKRFPQLTCKVFQKKGQFFAWVTVEPAPKAGPPFPGRLGPGESATLRHYLLADASAKDLLARVYGLAGLGPLTASVSFQGNDGPWLELVVREVVSSAVFFRGILNQRASAEISLPPGIYRVQANFFPATVEETLEVAPNGANRCALKPPASGKISVRVQDSRGEAVPGKVSFFGLGATRSPYFRPDNPLESGKNWEAAKPSCFPPAGGLDIELPVGTYLATASRGPEYSIDQRVLEVVHDENRGLALVIDRVVETPGLVALDPHVHTTRSDGRVPVAERIKSEVAEGIEVMVATDHNTVTDYDSALKELHLENALAVIPGSEVTVTDTIHYNTYPMAIRPGELGNGAIDASSDDPAALFRSSRLKNPSAVVEVNHPRAGDLGYFNNFYLDLKSGETALASLSTDFDVLEVMNGPYYYSSNETAIADWFHLLNRGYLYPIVGSSDSHDIDRGEPGYSRTYVYYPGERAVPLDTAALLQSIRKGRSFATNGPIVDLRVNGRYGPGELCPAAGGKVDVRIEVKSAPWVAVDEVRLVVNGERREVFPVQAPDAQVKKFERRISLELARDAFVCVEVLGKKTLFPVLANPSRDGSLRGGTVPFAITNPVFVDVDGNGKFDALNPGKIRTVAAPAGPVKKIPRL